MVSGADVKHTISSIWPRSPVCRRVCCYRTIKSPAVMVCNSYIKAKFAPLDSRDGMLRV